jgi:anti-sigma-K factor RskA
MERAHPDARLHGGALVSFQQHDLHQLTGAYAADALTGAELAQFERHLGQCPSCAEEVRGLRETAARLGIATSIVPPPAMRRRVLEAASRTRQLAPADRRLLGSGTPAGGPRRALPRAVSAAAMAAAVVALGIVLAGTQPPASRVYQLWLISVSGARSAGLMPASSAGSTPPVLTTDIQPGDHLGITIEPAGGSIRPTTAPVVLLSVYA